MRLFNHNIAITQFSFSHIYTLESCIRLDNKSAGRQSIASNLMKPDDEVDDGDSMAAYGEGDTGKQ